MGNKHKQKFFTGDIVHIAKDLGSSMSHFESDVDAVVEYSSFDRYGGDNVTDYSVIILPRGCSCSWYQEWQLTKIGEMSSKEMHELKLKYREDSNG